MKLLIENGQLKLSSAYRLIVTAWVISWGSFMGLIFAIILLTTLISGQTMVNGEIVSGRGEALLQILPFLILFPIIITLHAFMFGGFLVFGLWIYRKKRPIKVIDVNQADTFE